MPGHGPVMDQLDLDEMMYDLGDHRIEEIATTGDDSSYRRGNRKPHNRKTSGEVHEDPSIRAAGQNWFGAIKEGAFIDDDHNVVKGLDTMHLGGNPAGNPVLLRATVDPGLQGLTFHDHRGPSRVLKSRASVWSYHLAARLRLGFLVEEARDEDMDEEMGLDPAVHLPLRVVEEVDPTVHLPLRVVEEVHPPVARHHREL
ncbi:hypothetical protein GGR56DRAFT_676838 [Xylariaceae sp. FL0804]|nr:hypothetical protein GGR56DRAFT_676838 [Xylariaceae sp. FL0804]